MKYTCTVDISLTFHECANLWADERHFHLWQDGFQSIIPLEGKPSEVGSTATILLEQGKRKMELKETILTNNLPQEKKALYEHIHMSNTQTTKFEKIDEDHTRLISEVEYTQFNGFMPKMMGKLFPGMFKKQSQKWLDQFKAFAEANKAKS